MNTVKERKSRRTHKNSRDGCPNCKAKRIKCSEELPQCFNCIKKNYRCGYLDFPKDKLNHIRNKNEDKRKEELFKKLNRDQEIFNLPNSISDLNDSIKYHNSRDSDSSLNSRNNSLNSKKNSYSSSLGTSMNSMNSKQVLINETFNNIHSEFATNLLKLETDFNGSVQGSVQGSVHGNSMDANMNDMNMNSTAMESGGSGNSIHTTQSSLHGNVHDNLGSNVPIPMNPNNMGMNNINIMNMNDMSLLNNGISGLNGLNSMNVPMNSYDYDMFDFESSANQFVNFDNSNINILKVYDYNQPTEGQNLNAPPLAMAPPVAQTSPYGLPNAMNQPTVFKRIQRSKPRYHKQYFFLPVYNKKFYTRLWHQLFNQSVDNGVFQSFILDKSLGILLSNLNIVLTSDYLKNFHNTYHTLDEMNFKEDFFFNDKILHKLIAKSYNYYSNLIKDIRDNLNNYHIEYTIKISLLSSYSSYFLLNSSIDTLNTLNSGASSLLHKFTHEINDFSQLTINVKYIIDLIFNHIQICRVPNLQFGLIEIIFEQFKVFKKFLINSTSLYQSLQNSQSIRDFLPKHDCIEFENFLTYLLYNFLPKIKAMNQSHNPDWFEGCRDYRVLSYNLIFELINKWFKMYPSIVNTVASHLNVLQRVFYLFFICAGKVLNQIFSPIRSIMNIDCVNVLFPVVDFDFESFRIDQKEDKLSNEQFQYLNRINKDLLRMISFCNYRTLFYGHYLSTESVLDEEFISKIDGENDYIRVIPTVVDVQEQPLNVNSELQFDIKYENFPQFQQFNNIAGSKTNPPVDETHKYDDSNFNFETGLFRSDFDPTSLVNEFLKIQRVNWELNGVKLPTIKLRTKNLNSSRKLINKSVNSFKTTLD
ncbi:hypothetical protein CLIB1444_05S05754 [[Candida] jaroonii]|uniref:Uncharacterized protein n=1 Tax=[Candida] jaroonii TaxID=467808 RepID=A0ACA9Y8Y8_9ASCO|nr:hypothetical protein CLIB1444_05S05754 [[Candida] jaroonii]